jgi:hypothetical protein
MDARKFILKETAIIGIGQAICVAAMIGIFALLGYFDLKVLVGGIIGGVLAVANFFAMAISASLAADKAEKQDVKGGQRLMSGSYTLRLVVMFVILFACVKGGIANPIAAVLPLVFVRPVLTLAEFFRKKEENA